MLILAILLLIGLYLGALALMFVPMLHAKELQAKHIPTRNWVLAACCLVAAIVLGLIGLPAIGG